MKTKTEGIAAECCESFFEEPGAGNPHAWFRGSLGCELRNPSTRRMSGNRHSYHNGNNKPIIQIIKLYY